jgi:hypothetical protein
MASQIAPEVQQVSPPGWHVPPSAMQASAQKPPAHRPLQHWLELEQGKASGRQEQRGRLRLDVAWRLQQNRHEPFFDFLPQRRPTGMQASARNLAAAAGSVVSAARAMSAAPNP